MIVFDNKFLMMMMTFSLWQVEQAEVSGTIMLCGMIILGSGMIIM